MATVRTDCGQCVRAVGGSEADEGGAVADSGEPWDRGVCWLVFSFAQRLFEAFDLGVDFALVPRADVSFEDQGNAAAKRFYGSGGGLDDGEDFVPGALQLCEHAGGAVGQARIPNHLHGCCDGVVD